MKGDMGTSSRVDPLRKQMLTALSDQEFNRIASALEPVPFPIPTELGAGNEAIELVNSPTTRLAAIASIDEGGKTHIGIVFERVAREIVRVHQGHRFRGEAAQRDTRAVTGGIETLGECVMGGRSA